MNKKEAKIQYLKIRLEDITVPEWEKKLIRQKLGITSIVHEHDFTSKTKDELFDFVSHYIDEQLVVIKRKKRTHLAFEFLSDNLKTIYYLSTYSVSFEEDSLEQMYEYDESVEDMRKLSQAFRVINRIDEAVMIESILRKGKITDKEIGILQEHFWDSDTIVNEIEIAIEGFIIANIRELIDLQTQGE